MSPRSLFPSKGENCNNYYCLLLMLGLDEVLKWPIYGFLVVRIIPSLKNILSYFYVIQQSLSKLRMKGLAAFPIFQNSRKTNNARLRALLPFS